jgi:hypothetical protein
MELVLMLLLWRLLRGAGLQVCAHELHLPLQPDVLLPEELQLVVRLPLLSQQ